MDFFSGISSIHKQTFLIKGNVKTNINFAMLIGAEINNHD